MVVPLLTAAFVTLGVEVIVLPPLLNNVLPPLPSSVLDEADRLLGPVGTNVTAELDPEVTTAAVVAGPPPGAVMVDRL